MKALTASLVVVSLGCGSTVQNTETLPNPPGAFLITAEQIRKSGAHTAWHVLKQSAPMFQTSDEVRHARCHRGLTGDRSSVVTGGAGCCAPCIVLWQAVS